MRASSVTLCSVVIKQTLAKCWRLARGISTWRAREFTDVRVSDASIDASIGPNLPVGPAHGRTATLLAARRPARIQLYPPQQPALRPSLHQLPLEARQLGHEPVVGRRGGSRVANGLESLSRVHPSVAMTYAAQMVALRLLPAKQCTSTLPPSNRHLAMNLRHRSKWTHSRSSGTSFTSTHSYVNSDGNLGSKPPATVRTWVMFRRCRTSRLCAAPMEPRNTSGTTSDGSLSDLTFLAVGIGREG